MPHPQPFQLFPFEPLPAGLMLELGGTCGRCESGDQLQMHYRLSGNLDAVLIPEPSIAASRQDQLWQATCLECFVAQPEKAGYWEFNISPSGDWNVYALSRYREDLVADTNFRSMPIQRHRHANCLDVTLAMPLPTQLRRATQLELAICAVIALVDGSITYWALSHCATEADFHQRGSFVLRL